MLDRKLKLRVLDELAWEPSLDDTDVVVVARDGSVTLTGFVRSYAERCATETVANRVIGIKAITNKIQVHATQMPSINDDVIIRQATDTLAWDVRINNQKITICVINGWLTLRGEVDWHFQKCLAMQDICRLFGVVGVSNEIVVRPKVAMLDVDDGLKAAFSRNGSFDAENIVVTRDDSDIMLTGLVPSYLGRTLAAETAWLSPGVTQVHELLTIG